jgi:hypothetical protein
MRHSLLVPALFCAGAAVAQPVGDEFHVNTYTTGDQLHPDVSSEPGGRFVVVWDTQETTPFTSVHAQRYQGGGQPLGAEFRVNTDTSAPAITPRVAVWPGAFVVVWQRDVSGTTQIVGQRVALSGEPLGGEFEVASFSNATAAAMAPDVAVGANTFVVAWAAPDGSQTGIFARRYAVNGPPLSDGFQVNTSTTNTQKLPAVAVNQSEGFVVAWTSNGQQGTSNDQIVARTYDSSGSASSGEVAVNTNTAVNQELPAVAPIGKSGYVIAWEEPGVTATLLARRFSAAGAPLAGPFTVDETPVAEELPSIAADVGGDFMIVWRSSADDIFGRRYASSGAPLSGEFRVNSYTTGVQAAPAASANFSGGTAVVFTSADQDGDPLAGIFGQRFFTIGVPGDVNGDQVTNVADAFYLINYLFAGGAAPTGPADMNGDGLINVSDVFYLINYLFAGGPAPAIIYRD